MRSASRSGRRLALATILLCALSTRAGVEEKAAPASRTPSAPSGRGPDVKAPLVEDIRRWIADLGADRYATRAAATEKLEGSIEAAIPLLKQVRSDEPEVRARVESLIDVYTAAVRGALGDLAHLENVWREQDLDQNGQADYWTRDVAGFYALHGRDGTPLGQIFLEVARADAAPARPYAELGGPPVPFRGYFFKALKVDGEGKPYLQAGRAPPRAGNAPEGNSTREDRFGFCAYPARYGVDGRLTYFVSKRGVVVSRDLGPDARGADAWPAGEPEEEIINGGWFQFGG